MYSRLPELRRMIPQIQTDKATHGGKAQGNYQKSKSRQHQSQGLRRKGKGCHSYKYRQQPLACKCGAARTGSAYTVKGSFH